MSTYEAAYGPSSTETRTTGEKICFDSFKYVQEFSKAPVTKDTDEKGLTKELGVVTRVLTDGEKKSANRVRVFVECRLESGKRLSGWYSLQYVKNLLSRYHFDVVVNEPEADVLFWNGAKYKRYNIYEVKGRLTAMLWLWLTKVGVVKHKDIRTRLGISEAAVKESLDRRMYVLCSHYRKFLGDSLSSRMVNRGRRRAYAVPDSWPYCWIRSCEEREESELLYEIGNPEEYQ